MGLDKAKHAVTILTQNEAEVRRRISGELNRPSTKILYNTSPPQKDKDEVPRPWKDKTDQVADLLAAAKPTLWRGRGDLPQRAWPILRRGLWLVIDLWGGIASTVIAMASLGIRMIALTAEKEPTASACARYGFPSLVHVQKVEQVTGALFAKVIARRKFEGILLGGGSPCQGNSSLNPQREGLNDDRSRQPEHVARIAEELKQFQLPVVTWLENSGSASKEVRERYSHLVGSTPVLLNANEVGYVDRSRAFWMQGPRGSVFAADVEMPPDWALRQAARNGGTTQGRVQYSGTKPIPKVTHIQLGYRLAIDPSAVVANKGAGAMYTFTRNFAHPRDLEKHASAGAVARFRSDSQQYPPKAYEEKSLAWRGEEWRTLDSRERAAIHEVPYDILSPCDRMGSSPAKAEAMKCCLLGNGLHMPSFLVIVYLMLQLVEPAKSEYITKLNFDEQIPGARYAHDESCLRDRVRGGVFEPGRMTNFPGILSADQIVDMMQLQLPEDIVPDAPWPQVRRDMASIPLWRLQLFWAHEYLQGRECMEMPPDWAGQRERAKLNASLGRQRAPGDSKRGLDHLLPPGLGPEAHWKEACTLDSPFRLDQAIDKDLVFAAKAIATFGPAIRHWREEQHAVMISVTRVLAPISELIESRLDPVVARAASKKRPAHMAFLASCLRWPDLTQAKLYITGFPIIGEIDSSHVFRQFSAPNAPEPNIEEDFFGEEAARAVDAIMANAEPKNAKEIWDVTMNTVKKGTAQPPRGREYFDKKYGRGRWRPMPTFLVVQSCGKLRVINDARAGCQNYFTAMWETIFIISVDWVAQATYVVLYWILWIWCNNPSQGPVEELLQALPPWAVIALGLDDIPDAYNGTPVFPRHAPANIASVYNVEERDWNFVEQDGLGFGLESAVASFCRLPALTTSAARRIYGSATASYVDDLPTIDVIAAAGSGQQMTQASLRFVGAAAAPEKEMQLADQRVFLGTACLVGSATVDGTVSFSPKASTIAKITDAVNQAREKRWLSRGATAKLRGQWGWAASNTHGRVGRFATWNLKQHQYYSASEEVGDHLARVLGFMVDLTQFLPTRCVQVLGVPPKPLIVCSDASWEESGGNRIGWIIYDPRTELAEGYTMLITEEVTQSWKERETSITIAEAFATVAAPLTSPSIFRGMDVLWFIDNEAACAAAIRGCSSAEDIQDVVETAAFLNAALRSRTWYEWVDTISNASDGLSREGCTCAVARAICHRIHEVAPIRWQGREHACKLLYNLIQ
jgi:hypothetical protein